MAPSSASEAGADRRRAALTVIAEQLCEGIAAKKCHSCGCFPGTAATASIVAGGSLDRSGGRSITSRTAGITSTE